MISDLKPYPAMKDSGVPWLGAVPEHWEVKRLGALVRERGETNDDNSVTEVLSVMRERGVIPYAEKGNVGNKKSEDITRYKIVRPDDIVVNCMNVIIGSVGLSRYTGCLSPVYYVLTRRSKRDDPRYLNAYFQTKPFQLSLVRIGNGILAHRMRIPMELLKCELFPRPPAPEQAAIVRFLDHVDRRIRRYILAKQKLVKLLEEQKQAIIHRAVTRGLDPNVSLKSTGVEWLGDVPEHWKVKLLHHVLNPAIPLAYGILLPGPRQDEGVPYLGAGDVRPDRLRLEMLPRTTSEIAAAYPRTRVRTGELVYAIRGSFGNVEVIPLELDGVNLSRDAARLAPGSDVDAFWLAFLLRSRFCQEQFKLKEIGATITGVNIRDLKRIVLPVPPKEEQAALVLFLDQETSAAEGVIGRSEREISLLREYRIRLVADVVTGKLDVREAAARLPVETEESQPLYEADALTDAGEDEADLDAIPDEAEA